MVLVGPWVSFRPRKHRVVGPPPNCQNPWLINGGDPNHLLNGMILQVRQPFHIYHVLICNHIMPIEVASCNARSESPEANFCITSQTLQCPWQEGEIPDVRWGGHAAIREGAMDFFHRPTTGSKVHF